MSFKPNLISTIVLTSSYFLFFPFLFVYLLVLLQAKRSLFHPSLKTHVVV
nr:MAG TPA: hypothetical protein [Caudoviricetes sp.]